MKDYTVYEDEQLVELYKKGDPAVLNFICEKYKPLVLKIARPLYIVGAETDDLIQEGMIGLFSAIGDYQQDKGISFFKFAESCIKNHMFKAIDKSNRKKHSPLNSYVSIYQGEDGEISENFFTDENTTDPAVLLVEAENKSDLLKDLHKSLSKTETQVFDLYLQGLNYIEIAERLSKTPKSIDNTLTRIRQKAKKIRE